MGTGQETPSQPVSLSRRSRIGVRFRPDERAVLNAAAELAGVQLSAFIRSVTLDAAQRRLARAAAATKDSND